MCYFSLYLPIISVHYHSRYWPANNCSSTLKVRHVYDSFDVLCGSLRHRDADSASIHSKSVCSWCGEVRLVHDLIQDVANHRDNYQFPPPTAPFIALVVTMLSTFFITVFFNRYLFILISATLQVACLLWYLSTYIPGGPTGLKMLVKAAYLLVSTAMAPCLFICKKMLRLCISRMFS